MAGSVGGEVVLVYGGDVLSQGRRWTVLDVLQSQRN